MKRKAIALSVAMLSLASMLQAKPISGVIVDRASKEPLIGCVVQVKDNKNENTTTGLDGSFSLNLSESSGHVTLLISYLGYKPKELTVDLNTVGKLNVDMDEEANELSEVVVTGKMEKANDRSAVQLLKESSSLLNVMSQQTLQLSPDVNVAAALRRVSGVVMQDDGTGEASYAILRGMDKRYNYTLVNGIKIPSPDDKNRYVPLNLFPSHLMDRLVVYKSLTPDMEGDAAGGAINMDMRDAPGRMKLQADVSLGSSDYFWGDKDYLSGDRGNTTKTAPYEKYGPEYAATTADFKNGGQNIKAHALPMPNINANISVGDRWLNNRFGAIFAGSFQNNYRGVDRTLYTPMMAAGAQTEVISKLNHRYYSIHDLTYGLHAKFDYQVKHHHLEWYNMFVSRTEDNVRYGQTINIDFGYDAETGTYTRNDEARSGRQTQNIFASNLIGTHSFGRFSVDWKGIFAWAKENDPDRTYTKIYNQVESNAVTRTLPQSMERRFQHNSDRNWEGHINFKYDMPLGAANDHVVWKAGGMYRQKRRNNRYYSYDFNPADISQKLESPDFDQYNQIDWVVKTPYAQASQLNYNSKERIGAAYAMGTLTAGPLEVVAGFRAEHTNQVYTMLQKFKTMGQLGMQSYWDYLPSAMLKYQIDKRMDVRLSYYKSINRPGFYEIVPYTIEGDDYTEKGNPTLKRARIQNVDLRWEYFPSATEQVLVGVFYKYLKDPIETSFTSDARSTFYQPQNLGNAKNLGFEIDVIKYIRHFGVKANYTYTHSTITTDKRQYVSGKAEVQMVSQKRQLVNQAPHTANLSLLYKDTSHGWNAQLASAFTASRMVLVSPYKDADEWERGRLTLDLSVEKKWQNGISVFAKANNLTDARVVRYLKTVNSENLSLPQQENNRTILGKKRYGRTILVGVRFSM